MSELGIGLVSAVFSLLPVLLAVQVGQMVTGRGGRSAPVAGAALMLAAVAAMLLVPASPVGLGAAMAVLASTDRKIAPPRPIKKLRRSI